MSEALGFTDLVTKLLLAERRSLPLYVGLLIVAKIMLRYIQDLSYYGCFGNLVPQCW